MSKARVNRKPYTPGWIKAINKRHVRTSRRETIYKFLLKQHGGMVPCFVCGKHVKHKNATLEHIIPRSEGGDDAMDNLSISHFQCNQARARP